ncbi:hypothetical protein GALMADRAFT_238508 [Galerina marginata CBS 339.88]|uniref:Arrestin-like N-terminal domain-containing protein n=1 Tax=Galerina marginata (strain CBS 339.88) TaxID=685588 RepID=A0A067TSK0_GALM3|nr:hypothetical protein GALMADRAFT_238508 [Galerina marginata CBS 339.88]
MEYQTFASSSDLLPELPSYSPSSPSPSYSCDLARGERLLEHTPRASRLASTSLFIKKAGKTTVVLNEQEDGATIPSYGRQAIISGQMLLEQSESIVEVVLKVKAKLDTTISEAGGHSTKIIDDTYSLWSSSSTSAQRSTCPDQIPFSVALPATFKYGDKMVPLPPSYNAEFFQVPSLFVRSSYTLHFVITRVRHRKLDIWPKTKQILIPFSYVPRTRPHRPIIPSPCFFSAVKTSPEEWYQAVTCLKTRPNANKDPIYCHLFVPAGRIYGLTDTIPFHVQLTGNTCTLQQLFSGAELDRVMSVDSHNTVISKNSKAVPSKPVLRVSVLRQVSVSLKGTSSWKNSTIGEGTIWPIPPDLSCSCSSTSGCTEGNVDWEGELQLKDNITVGGFDAANVQVKDFIILTLTPPTPHQSPWLQLQVTIPIRLVTESWGDVTAFDSVLSP